MHQGLFSSLIRYRDLLFISMRQVARQYRRYFGIVLSIAFGTAGVIVILTMGDEVKLNLNKDLELLGGATVIKCWFERGLSPNERVSEFKEFNPKIAEAVRGLPGVATASLITFAPGNAIWNEQEFSGFTLLGIDEYYWDVTTVRVIGGAFFGPDEVRERQRVCVLGRLLALKIFGSIDVIGSQLPIRGTVYRVVGILGGANAGDREECAFIPFTTVNDRVDQLMPSRLYVRSRTWDEVPAVAEAIPTTVAQFKNIEGLLVDVPWGPLQHLKRIVLWVELFVIFAITATLVLGGFGIWNGMMTAVKARTREIGLKKAMGAQDFDILFQFQAEAVCLSVGAALLGVGLGRVAVELLARALDSHPPENQFFIYAGLSLIFSILLGSCSGIYPSIRASRMEVVSAIKYE
jgi:putative ABC transport system permease protein